MRRELTAALFLLVAPAASLADEFRSDHPPFRVTLLSLHRQRDLMLVRGPWIWVDEAGTQRPIADRTPRSRTAGGADFYARLRLSTEPPTFFRQEGPPRIEEAVDDQGQTLEPFDEPDAEARPRRVPQRATYPTRDVRLPLSLPEQPGKSIKRLKGTIPVCVTARSSEPLATIDLARAKGRTIRASDVRIDVRDVRIDPDRSARLKLVVTAESEKGDYRKKEYQESVAARLVDAAQRQIDLLDDQSRVVTSYATTAVRRNEARVTLTVRPDESYGPPDRLRVWGQTRTAKDIPFDFQDVPLP